MDGKKYFKLTQEDLLTHPVWVRSMDVATFGDSEDENWDDDTAMVVPLPKDAALVEQLFENCICWARARFQDASGRSFIGMLKCWAGDDIAGCSPTIVTDSGQVNFFFAGVQPNSGQIAESYRSLSVPPDSLFPIKYSVDIELPDGPPDGTLDGFYWLDHQTDGSKLMHVR